MVAQVTEGLPSFAQILWATPGRMAVELRELSGYHGTESRDLSVSYRSHSVATLMALLPLLLNSSSSFSDDLKKLVPPLVCISLEQMTFLKKIEGMIELR